MARNKFDAKSKAKEFCFNHIYVGNGECNNCFRLEQALLEAYSSGQKDVYEDAARKDEAIYLFAGFMVELIDFVSWNTNPSLGIKFYKCKKLVKDILESKSKQLEKP